MTDGIIIKLYSVTSGIGGGTYNSPSPAYTYRVLPQAISFDNHHIRFL